MENTSNSIENTSQQHVPTELLREKIRNYSRQQREKIRATELDALRFGLGEILAKVEELHNLTEKDVSGLASRIKRRKHATVEDMYRLCYAFLQSIENIRAFATIPGAIQVLVKELTGKDSERQAVASECLCNLSLGEASVCDKIANMAGSYLVTYLDSTERRLKSTSLWTLANVVATSTKAAQVLMQMELVPKLWSLYTHDDLKASSTEDIDYCIDAAICLQVISAKSSLLRSQDLAFIREKLMNKNPTSSGAEYHLQIIFNCDVIDRIDLINEAQVIYLINYALYNLQHFSNSFQEATNQLRLVYAIRVLSNLIATQPMAYNLLLSQVATVWQTNLAQILNKLFALENESLNKEIFWLLQTLLSQESFLASVSVQQQESFLSKLKIPQTKQINA